MPPAPVKVTRRCFVTVTRSMTSRTDASRPINSETGWGRFEAGVDGWTSGGVDLTGELIAAPCHRSNQIPVSAERLAQRGDLSLEVVFLHSPIGPNPPHQQLLVDDRAAGVDQGEQGVEGPTTEGEALAVGAELWRMRPHPEAAELQSGEGTQPPIPRSAILEV